MTFLRVAGGSAAALALHGIRPGRAAAQRGTRTLKIGYVSPQTGPLAGFGETDNFVVGGIRQVVRGGLSIRGQSVPVDVLVRDSQSDPNRAAEVASRLILSDKVDLMLVSSTPETTNPVSDQCEANGTPCISSVCPWQPWFFGRGGKPETGFKSTYHFFWGLEDIIGVFVDMWDTLPTNKVVGALWPNDGDGNAWGDPQRGLSARAGQGRLQAGGSRTVPESLRRLLGPDLRVQEGEGRDRDRRAHPAGLDDVLEAGGPAGLQAEDRLGRQGAALPALGRGARRPRRRACPPRCGGRRGIRSSPR